MRHPARLLFPFLLLLALVACQAAPAAAPAPGAPAAASACRPASEGSDPPYLDPSVCVEARVEDLLARMTLAEKVGQMTLVEKNSIDPAEIGPLGIGALLSGGGGYPVSNTPAAWADMVDGFQARALESRLGIPLLYGVDAIHGHNNVRGAVIFPHNVGLGATRDPALVERVARATAEEMVATGIRWNYAPVVAVTQDIRWGRSYEGFGEESGLVSQLATAYLRGLQEVGGAGALDDPAAVLATPKHFIGDGGTSWGSSTTNDWQIDQGVTEVDEATLRAIHLPPYEAAINAGALSIMVSYSSWGGLKMHAQAYLLTEILKGELGFAGFLVSDWKGIDQIPGDYNSDIVTAINAGVDMVMVPTDYHPFIDGLTRAVEAGTISEARVDDAVRRILRAKMALGLFERPTAQRELLDQVGGAAHRELAREAVRKSLVLLKNEGALLPLPAKELLLFVAGEAADDIGLQSGGWTIEWQGKAGNITPGTTILDGIKQAAGAASTVRYNPWGNFERVTDAAGNPAIADVGIVVVGERPYAEGEGDHARPALPDEQVELIERVAARSERVVVILISGRPLLVTEHLPGWDALVAAWLPGTEGQGVADALFGVAPFEGRLPYTWPRSADQFPQVGAADPLFPVGFGLTTEPVQGK